MRSMSGPAGSVQATAVAPACAQPRTGLVAVVLATLTLVLAAVAGCGSSSTPPPAPSQAPPVENATNLDVEPVIGKGTPPPPTALRTKDLVVGTGATAAPTSTVTVQYVYALYDTGQVFDSSWGQAKAVAFPLDQVVAGYRDGIAGMKVGGRREIVIPPDLGYGAAGSAVIPPNATLTFVVDLKKVS